MPFELKKILQYTALLALFSIPFGTKKFVHLFWGTPNELGSAFIFGTDIFALLFVFLIFFYPRFQQFLSEFRVFLPFVFFILFSVVLSSQFVFSAYHAILLFLALFFALALGFSIREKILPLSSALFAVFLSGVFQALVAFFQFFKQSSLGLRFFGESQIARGDSFGIARVAIEGVPFLRAYGTLPHANILAAFLGLAMLFGCALWLYQKNKKTLLHIAGYTGAFFVLLAGIVFSFSRSGWISVFFGLFAFFIFSFFSSRRKEVLRLLFLIFLVFGGILFSLSWAIFPRAHFSANEPSVNLRALYNQMGVEIIRENPLGVGIGNQTPYAAGQNLYPRFGIYNAWDIQPIHNLFLLIGAELGVLGLLAFITLFINFFISFFHKHREGREFVFALILFLFVFSLFDHFFWTLASGRLMFWGTLGIVIGVTSFSKPSLVSPSGRSAEGMTMDIMKYDEPSSFNG